MELQKKPEKDAADADESIYNSDYDGTGIIRIVTMLPSSHPCSRKSCAPTGIINGVSRKRLGGILSRQVDEMMRPNHVKHVEPFLEEVATGLSDTLGTKEKCH